MLRSSSTVRTDWLAAITVLSWVLAGCREDEVAAPRFSPAACSRRALQDYDVNRDGFLDDRELEGAPGLAALKKTADTDGDGKLSAEEISKRIRQFVTDNVAYLPVRYRVLLDGQPLEGAVLEMIPEPCLGEVLVKASGQTNPEGIVAPLTDRPELGGAQCGLYRIEISKMDSNGRELIPARYNRETTMGTDLSLGNRDAERTMLIELSSSGPSSSKP